MLFTFTWLPIPTLLILLIVAYQIHKYVLSQKKSSAKGKVVVITGCSSGLGEELTEQYAKQGAKLVISARRLDKLQELAERCKKDAQDVLVVQTDVSKEEECKKLIEAAVQKFGGIDILILNAGIGQSFFLEATKDTSNFRDFMEVNYWGCVYPTYYALPHLRKSKGRIAVISSVGGLVPFPRQTLYNSSKHALQGFYDTLRTELGGSGISITIANPGFVKTEMTTGNSIGRDGKRLSESIDQSRLASLSKGMMSAKECVRQIIQAIGTRQRNIILPTSYKIWPILKFFAPELMDYIFMKQFVKKSKKE